MADRPLSIDIRRPLLLKANDLVLLTGEDGSIAAEFPGYLGSVVAVGGNPARSVVNSDGRFCSSLDPWVCDGAVFATAGGVNPALAIRTAALRTADWSGGLGWSSRL